jgi:hypothetical protein
VCGCSANAKPIRDQGDREAVSRFDACRFHQFGGELGWASTG